MAARARARRLNSNQSHSRCLLPRPPEKLSSNVIHRFHPTSDAAWRPDVNVFAPTDVIPDALILQCSTVAGLVEGYAPAMRVAYIDDDEAVFKAEGDPLDEGEPDLAEVLIYTAKLTQLDRVTNEQFAQTSTSTQISESVARAIVRRANQAFVAEAAPVAPAVATMPGLVNLEHTVDGGTVADPLDVLDLVAQLQDNLSTPSHILVDPLGWGELRKLKTGTDFNSFLLGAGTTDAQPMLLSLPVVVDPSVPDYSGIVLDRRAIVSAVGGVKFASSEHQLFSSDSVLLRATWRFGHVMVRPDRDRQVHDHAAGLVAEALRTPIRSHRHRRGRRAVGRFSRHFAARSQTYQMLENPSSSGVTLRRSPDLARPARFL